ncbi:hypothetical protein R3P38DRAFT_3049070 [Favolaschia claudopus]|uniref:Uncharacterized protein n=1 Tax=Favolaschia claudopus TaxID=2862362 RepID=A0AAW0A6G8_9AGAR
MKLTVVPLIACTALLTSASPLRVIVVSKHDGGDNGAAFIPHVGPTAHLVPPQAMPCGNHNPQGIRAKVSSLTNSIKIAFGFRVEEHKKLEIDIEKYRTPPFIGTPSPLDAVADKDFDPTTDPAAARLLELISPIAARPRPGHAVAVSVVPEPQRLSGQRHRLHHLHHPHHPHAFHRAQSFLGRVHFALLSLGPWEGRAVAFVLGCGIGVLLRMVYVLLLVSYRFMFRSPRSSAEEDEYTLLEHEDELDAEEIFVAPPMYTYPVDEKVVPKPEPIPVPVPVAVKNVQTEADE